MDSLENICHEIFDGLPCDDTVKQFVEEIYNHNANTIKVLEKENHNLLEIVYGDDNTGLKQILELQERINKLEIKLKDMEETAEFFARRLTPSQLILSLSDSLSNHIETMQKDKL